MEQSWGSCYAPHLHPIPKHPERQLPNFNPDNGTYAEEYLNNFMLAISLNAIIEENVVSRLFPYSFVGTSTTWYFSLPTGSINTCNTFEEDLLKKIGDDKTTTTLINEFENLKISANEKVKDFNSRFNKLLSKIPDTSRPIDEIQIEWYTSALLANAAMFVDRAQNTTLTDNMKEAISVEK